MGCTGGAAGEDGHCSLKSDDRRQARAAWSLISQLLHMSSSIALIIAIASSTASDTTLFIITNVSSSTKDPTRTATTETPQKWATGGQPRFTPMFTPHPARAQVYTACNGDDYCRSAGLRVRGAGGCAEGSTPSATDQATTSVLDPWVLSKRHGVAQARSMPIITGGHAKIAWSTTSVTVVVR